MLGREVVGGRWGDTLAWLGSRSGFSASTQLRTSWDVSTLAEGQHIFSALSG